MKKGIEGSLKELIAEAQEELRTAPMNGRLYWKKCLEISELQMFLREVQWLRQKEELEALA